MTNIRVILLVVVCIFVSQTPRSLAKDEQVTTTCICELAKNPDRYATKKVRVRAFILSDLRHTTVLVDHKCEDVGVSLASGDWEGRPIKLVKDKNYEQLESLHPKLLELRDKGQYVYATFEGLFEWSPNNRPLRELVLQQVSDLWVAETDNPKYAIPHE